MEEEKKTFLERIRRFIPYIFTGVVLLCVGLSMIGNFFDVRLRIDGEKIDTMYHLTDLLFASPAGVSTQIYFLLVYLILPILGCAFVFLGKIHNNFYVGAVLLFLLAGISAILSKDVTAAALSAINELSYSTHDVFFCFILPVITFFVAALFALVIGSSKVSISVPDITEMGVLIGLALALNFVKIVQLGESGGSVNFQMLPLFILALRKGPLKGFVGAGIAYGLISCITDGYGIATYPFDYLLGMGSTCVLGFFSPLIFGEKQESYNFKGELFLLIGGIAASFFRFIGGCASSMIIYGYNFAAAAAYNVLYVFISGGIAIAVLMAIYGPFIRVNRRFPSK